ncbi:MAG: hypothetical protein ACKOFD_09010, partial [Actinomycetota bacterium]
FSGRTDSAAGTCPLFFGEDDSGDSDALAGGVGTGLAITRLMVISGDGGWCGDIGVTELSVHKLMYELSKSASAWNAWKNKTLKYSTTAGGAPMGEGNENG